MTIHPKLMSRKALSHRIMIMAEVVIRQGDKVVAKGLNHFVNAGLITLANAFSSVTITHESYSIGSSSIYHFSATRPFGTLGGWGNNLTMRIGTDTITTTGYAITDLIAKIDVAPNSIVITRDSPTGGTYRAIITCTWNAGTVSGTIGEIGLFCSAQTTLGSNTVSQSLWSRLSVADGDFTAFTINTSLPLSIEWRIVFAFA